MASQNEDIVYFNSPWIEKINFYGVPIIFKEIQMKEDEPLLYIAKCISCGEIFHTDKSANNHVCKIYNSVRHGMATIYLIKWLSIKMLSINSIESSVFKKFCQLLDPQFVIPNKVNLRSLIIDYSKYIKDYTIINSKSSFLSIMIDGTTKNRHHFISLILYSRVEYIYYTSKIVFSENTVNISDILRDCIQKLEYFGKTVCSICSDNAKENKAACKFDNLEIPIYRQYCNCHCSSLAVAHLFEKSGKYHHLKVQVLMALRVLKHLNPPSLTEVRWKSLSDCANFIFQYKDVMVNLIDQKKFNSIQSYVNLKNVNWEELTNASQIMTSYIIKMEGDQMKIEFVFTELLKTIGLLKLQGTQIANDLIDELIKVYVQNDNLNVPLAAFLLTNEGAIFWQQFSEENKEFFFNNGWDGICHFCSESNIETNETMKMIFQTHLCSISNVDCDPFYYWESQKNELSEVACKIFQIPCSETAVERLFGGLSFMYDPYSNRMDDDLIDSELTIRMSSIFQNSDCFDGNILEKLKSCTKFYDENTFPLVK